jgi:antitoxin MazE
MLVTLNKWGNSEAIRIPKQLAETLKIHRGDKLDIRIENDALVIKKAELKGRDLVEFLLKDFEATDSRWTNEAEDWDLVGEESWEYGED